MKSKTHTHTHTQARWEEAANKSCYLRLSILAVILAVALFIVILVLSFFFFWCIKFFVEIIFIFMAV